MQAHNIFEKIIVANGPNPIIRGENSEQSTSTEQK
jgi:hypothetical protein